MEGPAPRHPHEPPDSTAVIQELAGRQHGVVGRAQLLQAGVPVHAIDHRVKRGLLESVYRGVYRAGPVAGPRAAETAALLACGSEAVLSHRTAARLWGLVPVSPAAPVEVTVRRGHRNPGPSAVVHRTRCLDRAEIATMDGLPLTVPTRTLLDLAGVAPGRVLERALAKADRTGLASREEVTAFVRRSPPRPGKRVLTELLERGGTLAFTRSEAEATLLRLVRKARLPPPRTNVNLKGYEVDFLWRKARLVVEVDGFAYHSSSSSFEDDRRRDATLTAAGFRVMRVTWRQITRNPEAVLARLAQALACGRR